MNIFYVYELVDSLTNIPFYVGKGSKNRILHHLSNRKIPNKKLFYKIKKIGKNFIKINKIYENLIEDDAFLLERMMIYKYRKLGFNLCNLTDGGEGSKGHKWSDDLKKWKSDSMKGDKNPNFGKTATELAKIKTFETNAKEYMLITPSGDIITIKGMKTFCREHGLCARAMFRVIKGVYPAHKGYKLYKPT